MPELDSQHKSHFLEKSESLSKPRQTLGEIGGGLLDDETDKQYHSIASKVYAINRSMESVVYRLSDDDQKDLRNIDEAIPNLIRAENRWFDQQISEHPDQKDELDKLRHLRILKHQVLRRYIQKLREEDSNREKGQGRNGAPTIDEAKKDAEAENKQFSPREFRDSFLPENINEYKTIRSSVVDVFDATDVTLRADYLNGFSGPDEKLTQVQADLIVLTAAKKKLIAFAADSANNLEVRQINEVILPALDKTETKLLHLQQELQKESRDLNSAIKNAQDDTEVAEMFTNIQPKIELFKDKLADISSRTIDSFTSVSQIELLIQEIQKEYLDLGIENALQGLRDKNVHESKIENAAKKLSLLEQRAKAAIETLNSKAFDVWKKNVEKNPNYVDLNELFSDATDTTNDDPDHYLSLRRKIIARNGAMNVDKINLLHGLDSFSTGKSKAELFFTELEKKVNEVSDNLLDTAYAKWVVEIETADLEGMALATAIHDGLPPKTDLADLQTQDDNLNNAIAAIEPRIPTKSVSYPDLSDKAKTYLDDRVKEAKRIRKDELKPAMDRLRTSVISRLSDAILQTTFDLAACRALDGGAYNTFQDLLTKLEGDYAAWKPDSNTNSGEIDRYDRAHSKLQELVGKEEKGTEAYRVERWNRVKARKKELEIQINADDVNEIRASLELLPDGATKEREKKNWKLVFELWDAYVKGWTSNNDDLRLLWTNTKESRKNVKTKINTKELRDFRDIPEVQPLVRQLEAYFQTPQSFVHTGYNYETRLFDSPLKGQTLLWDYAANGDPEEGDEKIGVPKLQDRLEKDLLDGRIAGADPRMGNHLLTILPQFVLISEMRWKYFAPRYANYLASPKNHPVDAITDVDPMAGMLYYIRSKGIIDPENYLLWSILRLPKESDYVDGINATKEGTVGGSKTREYTNRDIKNKNLRERMNFPLDRYDAENEEGLPKDTKVKSSIKPGYTINGAVRNDLVISAIEARTFRDQQNTLYDDWFTPVRLGKDLNVLPFLYDLVSNDEYVGLSYDDYISLVDTWNAFLSHAQNPKEVEKGQGPKELLTDLGSTLSKFKDLYNRLHGPERQRLIDIAVQVILRYIKNIYDKYDEKFDTSTFKNITTSFVKDEPLTGKQRFAERMIRVVDGLETVPPDIRKDVIEVLKISRDSSAPDIFSDKRGHPIPINNIGVKIFRPGMNREANRREKLLIDRYRLPTPQEKSKDH